MRSWYSVDETREPWCFLSLTTKDDGTETSLTGWALADGNAGQLVSTDSETLESYANESELTVALSEALDARRYSNQILVTSEQDTVVDLRLKLLSCPQIPSPTLRGFTNIALNGVLNQYFGGTSPSEVMHEEGNWSTSRGIRRTADPDDPVETFELLWEAWTTVYQLLPVTTCLGDPL